MSWGLIWPDNGAKLSLKASLKLQQLNVIWYDLRYLITAWKCQHHGGVGGKTVCLLLNIKQKELKKKKYLFYML